MAKKNKREFRGDTKPDLITKAAAAIVSDLPQGVDENGECFYEELFETPTSIELTDEYVKVWFEYDPDYDDDYDFKWEWYLAVPAYHFWGKKKRDKYLKEQKKQCDERKAKLDEILIKLGLKEEIE